jgi:N-ethylmaleimide reductase
MATDSPALPSRSPHQDQEPRHPDRPAATARLRLGELTLPGRSVQTGLRPGQPFDETAALSIVAPAWILPEGAGPEETAGIWRDPDVAAWRRFTARSAATGRSVALPLWHAGRLSHPLAQPGGDAPVAPSPIAAPGGTATFAGWRAFAVPRALDDAEIRALPGHYAAAARRARLAGFDAVEVHAARGGLLHQFLDPASNRRGGPYGGSAEACARPTLEILQAVAEVVGPSRLGLVLPWAEGPAEAPVMPAALALLRVVAPMRLAWLRLAADGPAAPPAGDATRALRDAFGGPLILGPVDDAAEVERLLREGLADAVSNRLVPFGPATPLDRAAWEGSLPV